MDEGEASKELLPGADDLGVYSNDLIDVILAAGVAKHVPKAVLSRLLQCPSDKLQAVRDYFEKQLDGMRAHKKVIDEVMADIIQIKAFQMFQAAHSQLEERIARGDMKTSELLAAQDQMLRVLQKMGGFLPKKGEEPDSEAIQKQRKDLESE